MIPVQNIQCGQCKHIFKGGPPPRCTAFPDGIPGAILTGEHDHTKAYPGDRGIRFEPTAEGEKATVENALIAAALAEKGGAGSGNWGHTSTRRIGEIGGSDPGGGLGALGLDRSATPEARREAAQALAGLRSTGIYGVQKVDRWTWEIANGVKVAAISMGDPRFSKGERGPYGIHQIGEVRVGDHTVGIYARNSWVKIPGVDFEVERPKNRPIRASDRDQLLEKVIVPTLQQLPPEHLEGLHHIEFGSNITGVAAGQYHAWGPEITTGHEDVFGNPLAGDGWIQIESWNQHFDWDRDGSQSLQATLKHELGHHVWGSVLSDQDRVAYARGLGYPITEAKGLDFYRGSGGKWSDQENYAVYEKTIKTPMPKESAIPRISQYGETNLWEDFAEFYRAYDATSGRVTHRYDGMAFWDQFIAAEPARYKYHPDAVGARARLLPIEKLRASAAARKALEEGAMEPGQDRPEEAGRIIINTPDGGIAVYGTSPTEGGMVLGTTRGGEGRLSPGGEEGEGAKAHTPDPPDFQAPLARRTIEQAGMRGLGAYMQQLADGPEARPSDPDSA